jgi:uncharacterized membrane protein HdeD (DUF308 family)
MMTNRTSDREPVAGQIVKSMHEHGALFLLEGAVLIVLGLVAGIVPSIATATVTPVLGWLFLLSGLLGLGTTFWAHNAPGYWWSLVSALLAILVGMVLLASKLQDLYGGVIGWPLKEAGPLRMILALFFLVEGGASIMFAIEHRNQFSGRWAWMLLSGVVDIVLACIIVFDLPGTSAWTMGLLVGTNMLLGGFALIAMGLHARAESANLRSSA